MFTLHYTSISKRIGLEIDKDIRLFALNASDEALEAIWKGEPLGSFCRWCLPLKGGKVGA
ncbi:MAG: hypothetical protein QXF82_06570 [Nitrososphaeria archaeon]